MSVGAIADALRHLSDRLAWGGREGLAEAQSMVIEKVHAAGEAMTTLMLGGSPDTVIARYREHVAANTKRLSGA